MDASSSTTPQRSTSEWAKDTLSANKRLHEGLLARVAQLEAEIRAGDRLLEEVASEFPHEDDDSEVWIPGGKKPISLWSQSDFLKPDSPFHALAKKRADHAAKTTPHPMKPREVEALGKAIRLENERLQAYKIRELGSSQDGNLTIDLANNVEGLDWQRIAERVSDGSSVKRTALECEIAWIGNYHPTINHGEWYKAEVKALGELVRQYEQDGKRIDWVDIAKKLGTNRTPIDCLRHGLVRPRFKWTSELDGRLMKGVEIYGINNWQRVAKYVSEYAMGSQCQTRWTKSLDPGLKRGAWSPEEDNQLRRAFAAYGSSWMQVATAVPGRTNDQCRERWLEQLSRAPEDLLWSEEEDKALLAAVEELGKQWKAISLRVGNKKTGPNCRMRYEKLKKAEKREESASPWSINAFSASKSATPVPSDRPQYPTSSITPPQPTVAPAVPLSSAARQVMSVLRPPVPPLSASTQPLGSTSISTSAFPSSEEPVVPEQGPAKKPRPKPKPITARRSTRLASSPENDASRNGMPGS